MSEYVNLMKDGKFVAGPFTENLAFEYLLRVQGQSAEYALTYGGYAWQETEDSPAMAVENCFVGTTADGTRVFLDMKLSLKDGAGRQTVTHETVAGQYVEFSASGHTVLKYRRADNWDSAGQMLDELLDVTVPAPGWSLAEIQQVQSLWYAWHLNGMNAACKHMPADARKKWDARESVICPDVTGHGYSYGSAWLIQPLPATVLHDMQKLIRKALSTIK